MTDGRPAVQSQAHPPDTLIDRYSPDDLALLDADARERFLAPFGATGDAALAGNERAWRQVAPALAWELLYRKEPELWERLVAGERIHPDVISLLPRVGEAIELAAGTGRLTFGVAPRCDHLVAFEPVAPFRERLVRHLSERRINNVDVLPGFFDAIALPDAFAELVVSCSSFTSDPAHGGDRGLDEMARVLSPGGMIALVWPADVEWLRSRGFTYESFEGEMAIDFGSHEEAVELARIFYPVAVDAIVERRSPRVPYELIGVNPPRDVAWKLI